MSKERKPETVTSKGELVRDDTDYKLTENEKSWRDNPWKTPPSNITNKQHPEEIIGQKG